MNITFQFAPSSESQTLLAILPEPTGPVIAPSGWQQIQVATTAPLLPYRVYQFNGRSGGRPTTYTWSQDVDSRFVHFAPLVRFEDES